MLWASNETSRAEAAQLRDDEHLSSFVARILDLNRCGWICNSPLLSNYQKLIINLAASSGCTGLCSAPRQRAKSGITHPRSVRTAQLALLPTVHYHWLSTVYLRRTVTVGLVFSLLPPVLLWGYCWLAASGANMLHSYATSRVSVCYLPFSLPRYLGSSHFGSPHISPFLDLRLLVLSAAQVRRNASSRCRLQPKRSLLPHWHVRRDRRSLSLQAKWTSPHHPGTGAP